MQNAGEALRRFRPLSKCGKGSIESSFRAGDKGRNVFFVDEFKIEASPSSVNIRFASMRSSLAKMDANKVRFRTEAMS